jgi:3-dehydroquinate synthase
VYVGLKILDKVPQILRPQRKGQPIEIVSDRTVDAMFAGPLEIVLRGNGWSVNRTVAGSGEKIKSARVVASMHEGWFARGYDRSTPIIALGGGTVGDTTGFAAATFLRGLPFWQIPTTIIAQVDAAIGGKVGINHARGKNLIGCFYQPQGIIVDPLVLATLPKRERRSGLAEVVKYGIIGDPRLFARCERHIAAWANGDAAIADDVIKRCIQAKLRIVARDERDTGLRHALNFGHTLGHALERWAKYRRLRHGEAVALGMYAAGFIARKRRYWTQSEFTRLASLCKLLRPVRNLGTLNVPEIISHLSVDKKRSAGRNVWVLPRRIGEVKLYNNVTEKEIRGALLQLARWMTE